MSHKLRKLLMLGAIGGAAAVAYKKITGRGDDEWQSAYEPTTPAEPTEDEAADPEASTGDSTTES
ncbi:MAG: hypothetical protein GEU93_05185 [Propionibacteriales bacterium]|nr:hypothetical protein [Propionibacteriales bacterium]